MLFRVHYLQVTTRCEFGLWNKVAMRFLLYQTQASVDSETTDTKILYSTMAGRSPAPRKRTNFSPQVATLKSN